MRTVTFRVRSLVWFATGALLAVAFTLLYVQAWQVDAAPGANESTIVSVEPARVLDSRDPTNLGLEGPFVSAVSQKLQVTGTITTSTGSNVVVPPGATGVLMNVTATGSTANGFVSIRPGDAIGPPTTSSLNFAAGTTVPNAVQVALPTNGPNAGKIDITFDALGLTGPTTDLLIDIVGYTTSTGIQSLTTDLAAKANTDDVYAKTETYSNTEIDAALATKPDTADVYAKTETYSNTEIDAALATKPDTTDVYTKAQLDPFAPDAFGEVVGASGNIASSRLSFGTVITSRTSTGTYRIAFPTILPCFPFPDTRPFVMVDIGPGVDGARVHRGSTGCGGTGFFVDYEITDPAGTLIDSNFAFLAFLEP